ncbi:Protein AE7 [Vitis vinifera]|uniref:Protein AE7 n=1 Tax=Vitis vinifera TaxID=29760 RepID=A0A438JB00_VITVI|nr:Protein AE7 [Vitis vinifera]
MPKESLPWRNGGECDLLILCAFDKAVGVDIKVAPGTHATEAAVNKQLNDKERVAAALENPNLLDMVDECLAPSYG